MVIHRCFPASRTPFDAQTFLSVCRRTPKPLTSEPAYRITGHQGIHCSGCNPPTRCRPSQPPLLALQLPYSYHGSEDKRGF